MDATSAMLAYTNSMPMTTAINPQKSSAVPPSVRTNVNRGSKISQLAITVEAKPNIVMNLKFRWFGLIWFISWSQSCETYSQNLLSSHHTHVSFVGRSASVPGGHAARLIDIFLSGL
jgi:hypothetical protein